MTDRHDQNTADWPLRPWLMAALCALAGLIFHRLVDVPGGAAPSAGRQAAAVLTVIAAVSFALTLEQRRWTWALGFALGWGAVIALVGWFTASYNRSGELFEFPFLSGIFAVLLAAPLFQTLRDEGTWRFPYARLHRHAWTDAVIGAASLVFTGVTFLLAWLVAGLFNLIGIDLVEELLKEGWFAWLLAGFAFGGALGLLRERDALAATLQRLVMIVLAVLAPVLAAALAIFLLSTPFTGLGKLWDSQIPATPLMLVAAAGAVLLVNAVIGNGEDDRAGTRVLHGAALLLLVCVLPLAVIAALSLGQRIGQYGWTPERIWGVVAVGVALLYGAAGWWTIAKGRHAFDDRLRPLQTRLALLLCGLALFLALPILDFGAISARSQIDRLAAGRTAPGEFDWQAMAFDFGPAGRQRLAEIARSGTADQRRQARAALATKERYQVVERVRAADSASALGTRLRIEPAGAALPPGLRDAIAASRFCRVGPCVAIPLGEQRAVIAGALSENAAAESSLMARGPQGSWEQYFEQPEGARSVKADVATAPVEVRRVERRQLFIDGQPVGKAFE